MKDLFYFLALCFGLTYLLHLVLYSLGGLASLYALPLLVAAMFVPSVAAYVVVTRVLRGDVGIYGLRASPLRYYLYALAYPLLAVGLGLLFVRLAGTAALVTNPEELARGLLSTTLSRLRPGEDAAGLSKLLGEKASLLLALMIVSMLVAPFVNAIPALGEEYGWRGYMLYRLLDRMGFLPTSVVIGVVWGLWHAPLILMGYNYPHHRDIVGILMFTAFCVLTNIFLCWLAVGSGSVYPVALCHGAMNAYLGLGPLLAPAQDELVTVPLGVPAIPALALIDLVVLARVRGTLRVGG